MKSLRVLAVLLLTLAEILVGPSADAAVKLTPSILTFYGWPDNDPPGTAIAHPGCKGTPRVCHSGAGGVGTFANPLSIAVHPGVFRVGTRVWVLRLSKYGIVEDDCAACRGVWVDVWMGGSKATARAVLACEDYATPDARINIVVNPPSTLPVNPVPLFNGKCNAPKG